MKSVDHSFYNSPQWKRCQRAYMKYVNGLCELCMEQNKIVPAKIVHHKIHMDKNTVTDSSLAYGFDNLQAVCQDCHNRIHHSAGTEGRRYTIVDGKLVINGD